MTELFGIDVMAMMYGIVIFDALLVLLVGVVAALMYLLGAKFDLFWQRVVPAVVTLVLTSLGAGVVVLIATKVFA